MNRAVVDPRLGPVGAPRGDGSRAVAIGGGHGLARTLRALTHVVDHVTAVVTVADDGGSSGRLRADFGVVPPGDLRMALTALCDDPRMVRLLQHRFTGDGDLAGHSLGNLVYLALDQVHAGDVVAALDELSAILGIRGRVLPCTADAVVLNGRAQGDRIRGQVAVATSRGLDRVWLEPAHPPALPEAVRAVGRADLVVLGPGSLYTSILPNLLVAGLADAVARARVPVLYVANLREQAGETEGMTLVDHVDALLAHVPGLHLDGVVVHTGGEPRGSGTPLVPPAEVPARWGELLTADLLDGHDGHAPGALARCFGAALGRPRPRG